MKLIIIAVLLIAISQLSALMSPKEFDINAGLLLPDESFLFSERDEWVLNNKIHSIWNLNLQDFSESQKEVYTYHTSPQISEHLTLVKEENDWINNTKETSVYNEESMLLHFTRQIWVEEEWQNDNRVFYSYDGNNRINSFHFMIWQNEEWTDYFLYEYHYTDNQLTEMIGYNKEADNWVNSNRSLINYNEAGNMSEVTAFQWQAGEWVYSSYSSYLYTNTIYVSEVITQIWQAGEWVNTSKSINEYNENDLLTLNQLSLWFADEWANYNKSTYSYDNYDRMIESIDYTYTDQWVQQRKTNRSYDEYGNVLQELKYNYGNGNWQPQGKIDYSWEELLHTEDLTIALNPVSSIESVFPNPFNPETTINLNLNSQDYYHPITLKVYNVKGQLIDTLINAELITDRAIAWKSNNVKNVSSGVYYLKLETFSGQDFRKITIIK